MKSRINLFILFVLTLSNICYSQTYYSASKKNEKTKFISNCIEKPLPSNRVKYCFVKGSQKSVKEGAVSGEVVLSRNFRNSIFSEANPICGDEFEDLSVLGINSPILNDKIKAVDSCILLRDIEIVKALAEPKDGNTYIETTRNYFEDAINFENVNRGGNQNTDGNNQNRCVTRSITGYQIDGAYATCKNIPGGNTTLGLCKPIHFNSLQYSCECTICAN